MTDGYQMSFIRYCSTGKDNLPNTKTICHVVCDLCESEFNRKYTTRQKHLKDSDIAGDFCQGCIQKLPAKRKKMSAAIKNMIKKDPSWSKRNSESKLGKINIGDKNGMKQFDARKKVSNFRKKMFKNPENRQKVATATAKAWANGKYDSVNVGRCKWHSYRKKDGSIAKCQGTWELAYAKWLDDNDVEFIAHRGRIKYVQDGISRSYYPDFYLIKSDEYIDVKNKYHFSLNEEKFVLISEQNPNITIKILFKSQLEKMGVCFD